MNHDPDNPLPFTGRFYDGLGNKVTMHAYANPTPTNNNAAGHGIIRFNKTTREITFECWPRYSDVSDDANQFPGWPRTIRQEDNYNRAPMGFLPTLQVKGMKDPVVQVVDEYLNDVVYTLRIRGNTWRPKVFKQGTYTIRVGEGDAVQVLNGIESGGEDDDRVLEIKF